MQLPRSLRVTPTSRLTHVFDVDERVSHATSSDTLKGMFFQRIVEIARQAGVRVEQVLGSPLGPPRYQPFFDYPVADYFRLVAATARALHPSAPISEAIRRTGGADFERFAESAVGRVMLAFGGSARATLARSGTMYGAVLKGSSKVESEATAEGVRIRYRDYPGLAEVYPIGTIEGCCRYFRAEYVIDIDVISARDADYYVRLKD